MTDAFSSDRNPTAAALLPDIDTWAQRPEAGIEELLRLFIDQAWPIRSIVAIDHAQRCGESGRDAQAAPGIRGYSDAVLIRRVPNKHDGGWFTTAMPPPSPLSPGAAADACERVARQASELLGGVPGNDLLLCAVQFLNEMMTPLVYEFSFRAAAVVLSPASSYLCKNDSWKLRRSLFDRGLICIGSVEIDGCTTLCFLTSAAVRSLRGCHVGSRGHVTMSQLGNEGRFANQLFRYAHVKLYALRHGLTPAFPEWEGAQLFALEDKSSEGLHLSRLTFNGFAEDNGLLWEADDPPIDVDLNGYFQEIPACWQRHRQLLRRLFSLPTDPQNAIDAWRDGVTRAGQRALVAIHVRRGDYRKLQQPDVPWFRLVPVDWYLDWLRAIWPTLRDPLLFVATDEPDVVLPRFAEFETVSADFPQVKQLPAHVFDFEILRQADYLAICNSSFSRMAAILAPATQMCFLPSFQTQSFARYEPWIDPAFWARFVDAWRARPLGSEDHRHSTANDRNLGVATGLGTVHVDVSDLILYLMDHMTLSGIQRVQCEILSHLPKTSAWRTIRFVALNATGWLGEIDKSALLSILGKVGSEFGSEAASALRALVSRAEPCVLRPSDIFLTLGAFWGVPGMGSLLQGLKNSGVTIAVFIHDILPIMTPEYFEARDTRMFIKHVVEALTFADFILTTSEYNKGSLAKFLAAQGMDPLPVHSIPLARELTAPKITDCRVSSVVAGIINKDYVLCVGTIEVRKNPTYLFNIWKLMVRTGQTSVPLLVFIGRQGWLVRDFMDQLKACNYLDGRIMLVHDVTDAELDLLYSNCMFTVFPSFAEGWGLPVGESLAQGKICICSGAGGIPEVGGKLLDYIDPYNAINGLELVLRYIEDPELRHQREEEIVRHLEPRSWQKVTDDFLNSIRALARQVRPSEAVAAVRLPANRFLPISADAAAIHLDGNDGALSAELACIRGWQAPRVCGAPAGATATMLRFRADAPAGTRINLLLQLSAPGGDCCPLRISSDCGSETEASVKGGVNSLAVLPCQVGRGQIVTVRLAAPSRDTGKVPDAPSWSLKGFLYVESRRLADPASTKPTDRDLPRSPKRSTVPAIGSLDHPKRGSFAQRVQLPRSAAWCDRQRASSFGAFLQTTDCYWQSDFTDHREAPIFLDDHDKQRFFSGCNNPAFAPRVGQINDSVKLVRRSNQFVSMSRFTEGSIFDRSGVWKALGYLQTAPVEFTPWLKNSADGLGLDGDSLAAAPRYEKSHLMFYNGNLHNYYHWVVEGLLSLDILTRALGLDSNLKITLPKSMDIAALLDHRESLKAVGFDGYDIVEVAEDLIQVQEAIWVDNDLIQSMPAPYVKDFQQRIAARYANVSRSRNRRLFIARKGPTRTIQNIEKVEASLSKYDFETVYLEGKSVLDQILLFQDAQFIIGTHGAGLSNLLFCYPGTKVIEFMPSVELRQFFWLISQKLGLVHGMQFCDPFGTPSFHSALTVDINKLETLLGMVDSHS